MRKHFLAVLLVLNLLTSLAVLNPAGATDNLRSAVRRFFNGNPTLTGSPTFDDVSSTDDMTVGDDLAVVDDATIGGDLTMTGDVLPAGAGATLGASGSDFSYAYIDTIYSDSTLTALSNANSTMTFGTGNNAWNVVSGGHLQPDTTASYDLGGSSYVLRRVYTGDVLAGGGGTTAFILSDTTTNSISLKSGLVGGEPWLYVQKGDDSAAARLIAGRLTSSGVFTASTSISLGTNIDFASDAGEMILGASDDTFLGRSEAGVVYVGATTGTADGAIVASRLVLDGLTTDGLVLKRSGNLLQVWEGDESAQIGMSAGGSYFTTVDTSNRFQGDEYRVDTDAGEVTFGASVDVFWGRIEAGIARIGSTTGTADGALAAGRPVETITGNDTLTIADNNKVIDNTGDGDGETYVLPAVSYAGCTLTFVAVENQEIYIDPAGSEQIYCAGLSLGAGDKLHIDDQFESATLTSNGTVWVVTALTGAPADGGP